MQLYIISRLIFTHDLLNARFLLRPQYYTISMLSVRQCFPFQMKMYQSFIKGSLYFT